VALLREQELMIIANRVCVLGAWTLRTEWQQCKRVHPIEIVEGVTQKKWNESEG